MLHCTASLRGPEGGGEQPSTNNDKNMIGMVLVTHGRLACEFRAALEHVVGPQQQLNVITIDPVGDHPCRHQDQW